MTLDTFKKHVEHLQRVVKDKTLLDSNNKTISDENRKKAQKNLEFIKSGIETNLRKAKDERKPEIQNRLDLINSVLGIGNETNKKKK